jgi:hypothetical protein
VPLYQNAFSNPSTAATILHTGAYHPLAHFDDPPTHDFDQRGDEPAQPPARFVPVMLLTLLLGLLHPLFNWRRYFFLDPFLSWQRKVNQRVKSLYRREPISSSGVR